MTDTILVDKNFPFEWLEMGEDGWEVMETAPEEVKKMWNDYIEYRRGKMDNFTVGGISEGA